MGKGGEGWQQYIVCVKSVWQGSAILSVITAHMQSIEDNAAYCYLILYIILQADVKDTVILGWEPEQN